MKLLATTIDIYEKHATSSQQWPFNERPTQYDFDIRKGNYESLKRELAQIRKDQSAQDNQVSDLQRRANLYADPERGPSLEEGYKNHTEQQLYEETKQKLKQQEGDFDQIVRAVQKIKPEAENMQTEL